MEKYAEYHPVASHKDSRSSSETLENGALLSDELSDELRVNHKCRVFKTSVKTSVAILCIAVYTAIVVFVTWTKAAHTYKAARRHGTRWMKCKQRDITFLVKIVSTRDQGPTIRSPSKWLHRLRIAHHGALGRPQRATILRRTQWRDRSELAQSL